MRHVDKKIKETATVSKNKSTQIFLLFLSLGVLGNKWLGPAGFWVYSGVRAERGLQNGFGSPFQNKDLNTEFKVKTL